MGELLRRGRKHYGKRRNCSFPAIPPFPTTFSKTFTTETPINHTDPNDSNEKAF